MTLQSVTQEFSCSYEIKRSKFIAFLLPYENFHKRLEELRAEHPKARHFVTAYRYFNEFNQIVEGSSDDGEPKGTSGKPSLMVLQGKELVNVAVIVVRYFGGIKLGTGGLVRAYSDAVNGVIANSRLVAYEHFESESIRFAYTNQRLVDYELEKHNIEVVEKQFLENVFYRIKAPKKSLEALRSSLDCVTHIPHR